MEQLELFPDILRCFTCRICGEELYDRDRNGICAKCDFTNSMMDLHDEEEITKRDLYEEAKRFCQSSWGVHYTGGIEIIKRRRWRRLLGLYFSHNRTIRMCHVTMREVGKEVTFDALRHELVHWYLHTTNQPHSDTDFRFIEECLKLGVILSKAKNAQEAYQRYLKRMGVE